VSNIYIIHVIYYYHNRICKMSSVLMAYFYHFLVHVAIVRLIVRFKFLIAQLIAIKICNQSAALLINDSIIYSLIN